MAGRPPKPLKIHETEGTYRADRHAGSVAKSTGGRAPKAPEGLDAVAQEMWRFVVAERGDWIAESDGPALQLLCETWSLRCRCKEALFGNPTDKDTRCSFIQYQADCMKMFARFGMTPTDRARLGEQSAEELDPAAEFIA
jgi:phage terminase small subunit